MKTIEEHNWERRNAWKANAEPWMKCGIKCPQCGEELFKDTMTTLLSNPPQKNVKCECGYKGYILA